MVTPAFEAFFLSGLVVISLQAVGLIVTFFAAFETPPLSELVIPLNVNVRRISTVKSIEPLYEEIEAYWSLAVTCLFIEKNS